MDAKPRRGDNMRLAPNIIEAICARVKETQSIVKTSREMGISPATIAKYARQVIEELQAQGVKIGIAKGGRRCALSQDTIAKIGRSLKTALSMHDVACETGLSRKSIQIHGRAFVDAMRADGSLGLCQCGLPRFHASFCSALLGRTRPYESEENLRRRSAIIAAIMFGEDLEIIGARHGLTTKGVEKYYRHLSPEDLRRRKTRRNLRKKVVPPSGAVPVRANRDPLYRQLEALIPRWLSPACKDDALSDLYVAYLDGRLDMANLATEARRYASRTAEDYESKFGPRSLDEQAFEDGRETLGDMIADPESLEPLEYRLSRWT